MTRIPGPVTGGKDASILIRVVMSPADTYAAALVCLLVIYFLCRICQPRYHDGTLNMTQETRNFRFNFLGLSVLGPPRLLPVVTVYNLPDAAHTGRLSAAILIMCIPGSSSTGARPP
jgi:hypothetical protein